MNEAILLVKVDRAMLGMVRKAMHTYTKERGIDITDIPFVEGRPHYWLLMSLADVTLADARKAAATRVATGCQCVQCGRWAATMCQGIAAVFTFLRRRGWTMVGKRMALCERCNRGGTLGTEITMFSARRPSIKQWELP